MGQIVGNKANGNNLLNLIYANRSPEQSNAVSSTLSEMPKLAEIILNIPIQYYYLDEQERSEETDQEIADKFFSVIRKLSRDLNFRQQINDLTLIRQDENSFERFRDIILNFNDSVESTVNSITTLRNVPTQGRNF